MSPELFDALSVLAFSGIAFGCAAVGVLALPWSDAELDETSEAVHAGWRWVDGRAARWLRRAPAAPAPSASFEGTFKGPSAPRAY